MIDQTLQEELCTQDTHRKLLTNGQTDEQANGWTMGQLYRPANAV